MDVFHSPETYLTIETKNIEHFGCTKRSRLI